MHLFIAGQNSHGVSEGKVTREDREKELAEYVTKRGRPFNRLTSFFYKDTTNICISMKKDENASKGRIKRRR